MNSGPKQANHILEPLGIDKLTDSDFDCSGGSLKEIGDVDVNELYN